MLSIGIDIGKTRHVAALISPALLAEHGRFDACPTLTFNNARAEFVRLREMVVQVADPTECHVLFEHTGHYGHLLEQFLREQGYHLYHMQARHRYGLNKTDVQDARALATLLYNEIELHAPIVDEGLRIMPLRQPSPAARTLRGLVRHRFELATESTQRKNKLTALTDELFPEIVQIYHDLFSESALTLREQFPTPGSIVQADIDDLCETRKRHKPTRDELLALQDLAASTIGTRDAGRLNSLLVEQSQLTTELRLMQTHIAQLDSQIKEILTSSRDAQILLSFPGISWVQAATLLAGIGSIANFESANKLRNYLGWSPRSVQTGSSLDSSALSKAGNGLLRRSLYLITLTAIRYDPWRARYDSMVARKCSYDGRKHDYIGKKKVIGHLAGQIIGVIYHLLRKDYDLLAALPPGETPRAPQLYVSQAGYAH
jgi:transposase